MEGREVSGITVTYDSGDYENIKKGCCVNLKESEDGRVSENISIELLNANAVDIVRIAYGLLLTVDRLGMTKLLQSFADGSAFVCSKDEKGEEE